MLAAVARTGVCFPWLRDASVWSDLCYDLLAVCHVPIQSGSEGEGNFAQRFWSAGGITEKSPKQLTLTGSELNVTQVCLDPKAAKGSVSTLFVKSGITDEPVPVCTLRAGTTDHATIDISFFESDGMVEFTVVGNAALSVCGTLRCTYRKALLPNVAFTVLRAVVFGFRLQGS
jgi:hypothetical protein